jgi:hypothetical protein
VTKRLLSTTARRKIPASLLALFALAALLLPSHAEAADIVGSWTSGLNHAEEAGTNRALVFTAHVEDDAADMNLSSVTYGGQPMTKVIERNFGTGYRAYVAAYILDEAGINAATDNTFTVTWAQTPSRPAGYSSAFLENVYQGDLIGASSGTGNTSSPIQTIALATGNSDMVIMAGTCGNSGEYTVENNFR